MPRRIDRGEIERVIREEGVEAALARWTAPTVRPTATAMGVWPQRKGANVRWKPEWDGLLLTMRDDQVAVLTGASTYNVRLRRYHLGIRKPPGSPSPFADQFNAIPPEEWARTLDIEIARRLRCSISCVSSWRKRNKLPPSPFKKSPHRVGLSVIRRLATEAALAKLGDNRDTRNALAHALGITRQGVSQLIASIRCEQGTTGAQAA